MTELKAQAAYRKKRVRIIKYMLVCTMLLLMIVPTIICVILFGKVNSIQKQVALLETSVEALAKMETDTFSSDLPSNSAEQEYAGTKDAVNAEQSIIDHSNEAEVNQSDYISQDIKEYSKEITATRKVYLTFDDGPSSNTEKILDILKDYQVKATFFVVGKEGEKWEALYRRIVDEGHTLGMHSYSHEYDEIYTSVEAYAADLFKLQDYLYGITGVESQFVRFPGGSSNKVSKLDMREFIKYLEEQDLIYYDWNISSKDATGRGLSASEIKENCLCDLDRHQNAVILMHDAAGKKTTVEALPAIIEEILKMENTEILPITEDTIPVRHITISEEETED